MVCIMRKISNGIAILRAARLVLAGLVALGLAGCDPASSEPEAAPAEPLAEPTPELEPDAFETPEESEPEFQHDPSPQVSILTYHEFSPTGRQTDMVIPTEKFRDQMQALKDAGVAVISMEDFLAWRRGEINIPDPSVLITIDDGWRSVYTDAFPILKEFGYPFTIFLYTNYIASGSRSLDLDMVREMLANGATLGCHSRSHPYPARIRRAQAEGEEAFEAFMDAEMVKTADRLEELFGVRPAVYAYPGGFYSEAMFPFAEKAGYEALFTVNPAKVTFDTPIRELHRYVIHGDKDFTFANATSFRGVPLGRKLLAEDNTEIKLELNPPDGTVIATRRPQLRADLSPVGGIDPESITMRVTGLGEVRPEFDPGSGVLTYEFAAPLRSEETTVFVQWKREGQEKMDSPLVWKFRIDRLASLLDALPPDPEGARRPPPVPLAL